MVIRSARSIRSYLQKASKSLLDDGEELRSRVWSFIRSG
ncbi:unnamed protein product [Haemonchus placei]|uniref:RUN domain-containing protein n=1 Tax=Haemonchus placei TaxID=6290 RepID=A0A0N4WWL5_HAEPC|nr:unnamed protein product [Haemonchus placei]